MEKQVETSDLAHEAMIQSIPAKSVQQQAETPCKDDDKACTKRWIDSFSDCC